MLSFWLLAAVARADAAEPAASRYLYVGAVFIFLIASEAWAGAVLRGGWAALGIVLLAGALVGNLDALRTGERGWRSVDASVRASLTAVEVAAPVVTPTFVPEPAFAPQVSAGPYLAAVADLGSPALTVPELERAPASTRSHSDQVLVGAERLAATPGAGPISGTSRPAVRASSGGLVTPVGLCERLLPTAPAATVDLDLAPGQQLVVGGAGRAGAALSLRRFAPTWPAPFAVARGASTTVSFPLDRGPGLVWHVRIAATRASEICVR
jgi:hypothetical protein